MYGSGIVTSDAFIEENPDVVEKFVQATYRGYAYTIANPAETTEILLGVYSTLDPVITAQQVAEVASLIVDPSAQNTKLGWLRADRIASTFEFIDQAFNLDGEIRAEDLYTVRFIR
jgi:NitT/TauT family transport system substrate-binding protein